MKRMILLLAIVFLNIGLYASVLPTGEGMFTYKDYPPFADRPVDVHYYIPASGDVKQMPIIFVFEGADRGYSYLLESWKQEAEKHNFMVFILHFDLKAYPFSDYQGIGLMDEGHAIRPAGEQTPILIDKIFEHIRQCLGSQRKGYMMYGHSAGGQFIQRFMLFYDSSYVEKAVIGSPGWYTFPDTSQDFPYGVRNIPYVTPEVIKKYLNKSIILQLGTADTIRESYLRKTPGAEAQGRDRYDRGNQFYQYLHQVAAERDWACNWQKIDEQGVGHNSAEMGKRAVPAMLGDSLRALFIGNSYTQYNHLVRQVQKLANSAGHKLSVKLVEHGGWTLKQHAANQETLDAIREGNWDFVVLQEQSEAPAREREWVQENVYKAAYSLDSLRQLYSPKGKTVFYMTWGHNIDTYTEMQQRLAESYLEMSGQLNAWCAPIGIAWKRVRTENPHLVLYDPDRSHPSIQGSYLAANVFCSVFFQERYTSDYYAGLPEEEALYLQHIAQETVFSNPSLWNIRSSVQPEDVTRRFYPDPERMYSTPTLNKPREEGLASLFEITCYLQELAKKHPDKVRMSHIGKTPQNRDIPVLYFGGAKENEKTRVWIQAGLHGNEPAGPEAACLLTDYLLNTPEGSTLLKKVSLALIPIANPDGYAMQSRKSGSGYDLNRDQSKLSDPVTFLLKEAYKEWSPEIALDIHEFNPLRKEFEFLHGTKVATAADVLFLPSGHLNISAGIRMLSNGLFREEAEKELKAHGYRSGFYFTPNIKNDSLYAVKGGKNPQSSSTFQGLTNAISLFIEIRGIGLGRTCFARRAECGFLVSRSLLQTAAVHSKKIRRSIQKSIKETYNGKNDIYITFQPTRTELPVSFIDFTNNECFTEVLPAFDALQLKADLVRKRPKAYILPNSSHIQVEKLRALGVEVDVIDKPFTANVEKYIVTAYNKAATEWENIYPVTVSTRTLKEEKSFLAGCFIIRLAQKNANLAVTLLEPESANGFVNFNVIPAELGEELPIYRII